MSKTITYPLGSTAVLSRVELTRRLKAHIWGMTSGRCWYCSRHLNPFTNLHFDHVIPISRGGSNDVTNFVPCCAPCNTLKGTKSLDEWKLAFNGDEYRLERCWLAELDASSEESGQFLYEREPELMTRRDLFIQHYITESKRKEPV